MDRNIALDEDVEGMARGSFDPNMGLEQFQSRPIHREVPVVTPSPVPVVVPQPLIRTPPTMMEDDGEESDGLNEFGLPRNPPRTPPGPPPADQPTASGFLHFPAEDLDDVSDDGDSTPRRTGPKTPPEPAPPTPPHIKLARELESDGELSEEDTDDSSQPGTRKMRRGGRSDSSMEWFFRYFRHFYCAPVLSDDNWDSSILKCGDTDKKKSLVSYIYVAFSMMQQ
ncbi:hypothetical protein CAEBREN_07585 [Caenorhabditis brenneri]|uniref:Uncharacterized protein n=1 Tax=Caenorhabditis brenneri TaxID=135651 RepID=G0M8J5_CAEBE|nr:hypothetical protein CAEBREN_07585 [Caenorhabditis brenneri]